MTGLSVLVKSNNSITLLAYICVPRDIIVTVLRIKTTKMALTIKSFVNLLETLIRHYASIEAGSVPGR